MLFITHIKNNIKVNIVMENTKPLIGLMPKFLWDSERLADIISAINRYLQEEKRNSFRMDKGIQ